MLRSIIHRLLQSLIVLLAVSFAVYGLMGLMPGDPIDLMVSADPNLTPADAARLKALYGLDQPLLQRYGHWLSAALNGDFGYSRLFAKPVLEVLPDALSHTARLMVAALALSLLIGLPMGMWAATRPYSKLDYGVNLLAFAGISIPPFWLGLLLILVFAVFLGILPAGGIGHEGGWSGLSYLVLPVASLTIASIGGHTRYMRAAMIETLRADHVRTARAKGLSEQRVVLGHALRNALLPVATIVGMDFGMLFSGALITETIFAYPGMGRLIYDAVMGNDFNLALVTLLLATAMTLLGNLLADLAYMGLDPRIHFREANP
ncbi:ABC transporter permease [Magnetospira sp. QH-2]|uniref:ABC transporter permease n=1 Tax=Magnetospira sp. (strain QH-2) TaxID=1288970 RepID=UPI0003E80BE8|nr:ABC transporter permease [Magnetospira sp. QH-2]CCQ74023.1 Putative oligopeptide transport system permease protein appB [Magnetospira sp. QH-2]